MGRVDKLFANTDGTTVTSRRGFFRYKKRFKQQTPALGRKQATHTVQGHTKGE